MLSPDARTVAFDLLRPPAGYRLDIALLTTYTLDLEALLALPLAVLAQTDRGMEEMLADPLLLHQALREAGNRIHVFVDKAGIAIPRKERPLYAMLESSVHPVCAPNGGAFHPKVWVARFTVERDPTADQNGDEAPLLRVAILSRNLTFDRSWDIALASEASPMNRQRAAASRPLRDLLLALPVRATGLEEQIAERVRMLAEEAGRTRFPGPEGLGDPIEFHSFGLSRLSRQPRPWRPREGGSRALAIAPFVNRSALDSIIDTGAEERMLVSRQEELDKLPDDLLSEWGRDRIFVLSDAALDEPEDGTGTRPSGLHAKVIAVEHGWDVTWYVGSANLTKAAFTGRNVEMMAAVTGHKGRRAGNSGYGIERFLEAGFGKLCTPYRRCERERENEDAMRARKCIEEARDWLVNADLNADLVVVCSSDGDAWTWRLECRCVEPLPDGVEIVAWPIAVSEEQARPFEPPLTWTLPIKLLTAFVAFRLHVPFESVDDIRMTLRLPTEGMPEEDRMHHVLRTLIDSPARLLCFLRALLGGLDGMADRIPEGDHRDGSGTWGEGPSGETLLEDLVRTASRAPERLEPVHRLINDFRKTEEGQKIIPGDLLAVWSAVDEALRKGSRS